jgi:hypothetical protein
MYTYICIHIYLAAISSRKITREIRPFIAYSKFSVFSLAYLQLNSGALASRKRKTATQRKCSHLP